MNGNKYLAALDKKSEPETDESFEEDAKRDGINSTHPTSSVIIEYENGNSFAVGYGNIVGWPFYDPSKGIQFVFEGFHPNRWGNWESGTFIVSLIGGDLRHIRDRLVGSKRHLVRINGATVTEVKVEKWVPPEE